MRDFLGDFLTEATEADERLHQVIHKTRERLYALELAENEEFVREHQSFSDAETKQPGQGLTAEEFAKRYLIS